MSRFAATPAFACVALGLAFTPAGASPLLPSTAPPAAVATGPNSGSLGELLPLSEPGKPVSISRPRPESAALDPVTFQAGLLLDPDQEGLQAVALSLKESAALRRVLGSVIAVNDFARPPAALPGAFDGRHGVALDGLSDRASGPEPQGLGQPDRPATQTGAPQRRAARRQSSPVELVDPSFAEDQGPTLRTVLHSLATIRRPAPRQQPRSAAQAVADAASDAYDGGFSLDEHILDSRMLGQALLKVVRPSSVYGDNSFSILGAGRFELALDLSSSIQTVNLSEQSSGASLSVPLDRGQPNPQATGRDAPQQIDLLTLLLNLFNSTTAKVLISIGIALVIGLGMFHFALNLRDQR